MESRDIVYLQEAYQEIYQLDEEVEIATEYFYEMGLNEYGVNTLIEELGVEEFVEWVYDIAESYTLEEETRLQRMSGRKNKILTGPKGSRPQSTTKAREKKQGGVTMRTSGGPKSTMRKRAVRAAAETQPETREEPTKTKRGIAGAIEYAKKRAAADTQLLRQGMRNLASSPAARGAATAAAALRAGGEFAHRAGQQAAQTETGKKIKKALSKVPGAVGGAAGAGLGYLKAGKSPAAAAGRTFGTLARKMKMGEEFEAWVEGLWEEGYDLSDYTWEGLYEAYIEEAPYDVYRGSSTVSGVKVGSESPVKVNKTSYKTRSGARRAADREDEKYGASIHSVVRTPERGSVDESYDTYNTILGYLLDEGYADNIESAEFIMNSMSEEWIAEILDEAEKVFPLGKVADKMRELQTRMKASKSPEEQSRLRKRLNKMGDEYWQPN